LTELWFHRLAFVEAGVLAQLFAAKPRAAI